MSTNKLTSIEENKNPTYTWFLIYKGDTIIGYTHTYKEADDICKKNINYSWDYSTIIKSNSERVKLYNSLPQLVISLIK